MSRSSDVVADLRRRVAALDEAVQPPPDLFHRIAAPRPARPRRRSAWAFAAACVATVAVAAVAIGVAVGLRSLSHRRTAGASGLVVAVFNAETPCQRLRTLECGLGVYADPHHRVPDRLVGRVWHGDRVSVACVVGDGERVTDESGVSSTRWYRVTTATGVTGYLPGVRTRNTVEVPDCGP